MILLIMVLIHKGIRLMSSLMSCVKGYCFRKSLNTCSCSEVTCPLPILFSAKQRVAIILSLKAKLRGTPPFEFNSRVPDLNFSCRPVGQEYYLHRNLGGKPEIILRGLSCHQYGCMVAPRDCLCDFRWRRIYWTKPCDRCFEVNTIGQTDQFSFTNIRGKNVPYILHAILGKIRGEQYGFFLCTSQFVCNYFCCCLLCHVNHLNCLRNF